MTAPTFVGPMTALGALKYGFWVAQVPGKPLHLTYDSRTDARKARKVFLEIRGAHHVGTQELFAAICELIPKEAQE